MRRTHGAEEIGSLTTSASNKPGLVSLVGAGPGDPGLITVAGLERLKTADVVVYDRLSGEALMAHVRPDAELIYVGKQPGKQVLNQNGINDVLVRKAMEGKSVCRLKGGDPFVFGRGGEEALACVHSGVPFEVIPGVTSAVAVPAYAGIPVTHRQVAASFAVITGHEDPDRTSSAIQWEKLATGVDTLVFLMGVENLPEISERLIRHGRTPSTPAALIQWGTTPRQRSLVATLEDIADRCRDEGFTSPAVTVIGNVVALCDLLGWYERRPLFGQRILVTRSREQASDLSRLLREAGAEVVESPTIRVRPYTLAEAPGLREQLDAAWDWVLFTSVNAVRCFFDLVREAGGDARSVGAARIAAVGPVTAEAVRAAGLRVDFMPTGATSLQIAEQFPESLKDQRLLLPRARVAPEEMVREFEARGASVTVLPVYETVADDSDSGLAEEVRTGTITLITFTSSSTVTHFLERVSAAEVPDAVHIACIGPVTAQTAMDAGLRVDLVAETHTIPGLVEAIMGLVASDRPIPEKI